MTEEEAKTKWCPLARVDSCWTGQYNQQPIDLPNNPNRHLTGEPHSGAMCIASRCMAWHTWNKEMGTGTCNVFRRNV